MAPIRVGLVGLSTTTSPRQPGAWAGRAHLPFILRSPDYQLVALANSTKESARRSLEANGLAATTKVYGSPEDLAKDPDVDMVAISVRVEKHFDLAKPAILNKKDIFVEWPLGASVREAEELTRLAKENGVRTIVGLQFRVTPVIVKLRQMLAEDKIGKVLCSTAWGCSSHLPIDAWIEGAEYYLDMKSGGNEFTINFGHFLDVFTNVLGGFADLQSTLKSSNASVPVYGKNGTIINPGYKKTSPEQILVQGTLDGGAVASIAFRKPQSAVDGTGIRWLITGTEGEIEITAPEAQWPAFAPKFTLKLKKGKDGPVEDISVDAEEAIFDGIDEQGKDTARLYAAVANGDTAAYATFETALETHKLLERIVKAAGWET